MKNQSLKKNFVLQLMYQIIILVIPLIIAPVLTRRMGDTKLGIYTYSYTIAYYFVVLAMLGIQKYGQRIISSRKNDIDLLRKTFWSLFVVHIIISIISFISYIVYSLFWVEEDKNIFLIQGLFVLSALFDITWLFFGIENFKSVVIRNAILKLIECTLVLCMVKTENDLWIYTLIMSSSALIGQIMLFPVALKYVKPIKFGMKDITQHIKPLFVLSIVIIAFTLYTVFDKTLLGILSTKENVAYYEYANKIINVPKTIALVIGTVVFPRACACLSKNDMDGVKKYYNYSVNFVFFISFASIFGLFSISDLFVRIYYGESFMKCADILKYLSLMVLIISYGDILRTQYLMPLKKDLSYTLCIVFGAVLNIILSYLLIKKIGVNGAVIGTLIAESVSLFIQMFLCRKYINYLKTLVKIIPFLLAGIAMYGLIYIIKLNINDNLLHLLVQIFSGAFVYILFIVLYLLLFDENKDDYKARIMKLFRRKRDE